MVAVVAEAVVIAVVVAVAVAMAAALVAQGLTMALGALLVMDGAVVFEDKFEGNFGTMPGATLLMYRRLQY